MGNSKVIFNAKVLIDLTGDTVAAAKLLEGTTAHGKDGERVTGKMLDRNTVGKHGAVGMASNFPAVAITPVTRNTQTHANVDNVNRLCFQPPAGFYNGETYVGESYGTVASVIGLNEGNLCAGSSVLDVTGRGHAVAMFAAVGDGRWSGGSYNRLKLAWQMGGGWGCWLPAGTYRACGAIVVPNCYIADAGSLSTRIYGAERVYGQSSVWGGTDTFTLNGSQWVSVTSGNSNYSECASVAIYRV